MELGMLRKFMDAMPADFSEGEGHPMINTDERSQKKRIFFQWAGSNRQNKLFYLSLAYSRFKDMFPKTEPDNFRIVFIGQVKDVAANSYLRSRVVNRLKCAEEDWIIFAAARMPSGRKDDEIPVPAYFFSKIAFLFGPEKIEPARYLDRNEWYEAEYKARMIGTSRTKVIKQKKEKEETPKRRGFWEHCVVANKGILQ